MWTKSSPPLYSQNTPPLHMSGPSHMLLQIRPHYVDIDSEYCGGGVVDKIEENEGGDVSVE